MMTGRSTAGSNIFTPPATFMNISLPAREMPIFFSRIAVKSASRLPSIPMVILLGWGKEVEVTRHWISTSIGRVPSILATTTDPEIFLGRSEMKMADGFFTSFSPMSVISKTPISFVAPNLFLTALSILNEFLLSPSKYSAASTRCSRILGPAIAPSFVT